MSVDSPWCWVGPLLALHGAGAGRLSVDALLARGRTTTRREREPVAA